MSGLHYICGILFIWVQLFDFNNKKRAHGQYIERPRFSALNSYDSFHPTLIKNSDLKCSESSRAAAMATKHDFSDGMAALNSFRLSLKQCAFVNKNVVTVQTLLPLTILLILYVVLVLILPMSTVDASVCLVMGYQSPALAVVFSCDRPPILPPAYPDEPSHPY